MGNSDPGHRPIVAKPVLVGIVAKPGLVGIVAKPVLAGIVAKPVLAGIVAQVVLADNGAQGHDVTWGLIPARAREKLTAVNFLAVQ
ncbi:MAG: hypothetical protein AB8B51_12630 [Sedimentitalea sp.]